MLAGRMRIFLGRAHVWIAPLCLLIVGVGVRPTNARAQGADCMATADAPGNGTIVVAVDAPGLEVLVGGAVVGETPVEPVAAPPGPNEIVVRVPGGKELHRRSVVVAACGRTRVNVETGFAPPAADSRGAAAGGVAARGSVIGDAPESDAGPWYTRWYVIGGAAAVVSVAVLTAILLSSGGDERGPAVSVPPIE